MAKGVINLQKESGGVTKITSTDGIGITEVVLPESGELATKDYADLKVALESFIGTNQSLTASGYQKLPGGLIIQWGADSVPSGTETTVTLPMAYPSGVLKIFATRNVSGISSAAIEVHAFSLSNAQIKLGYYNTGGGNASIMWMTLGY